MPAEIQQTTPSAILPNSTVVMVLGILSIFFTCCYGGPGLVLSIIALVLAKKDFKSYNENPSAYSPASYSNLKTGQVTAIIGLILSIIAIIAIFIYILIIGIAAIGIPFLEKTQHTLLTT